MGRYAQEPDNASKTAKAKGSNLRVHFKVIFIFCHTKLSPALLSSNMQAISLQLNSSERIKKGT